MRPLQLKGDRKIDVAVEKDVEEEEIEGDRNGTLNGKNVLFRLEESQKQLKEERK